MSALALFLQTALTTSQLTGLTAGQTALNTYFINQLESNGGLFNYDTREYLFSGRLDHHISEADSISLSYRYGHDLEENPDVQSLTGFSAGSSIHDYDNNLQASWYHVFSPRTENEFRFQWDYDSFNVIPNEPGEVGVQIAGFANNLGTNIFLPNLTILRRYELADNVTLLRGSHTIKFGGNEILRGNHTESHTFLPGRFVFGPLPGTDLSPQLSGIEDSLTSLQAASLSAPQVYQQGFGNPDYPAYTRPLTGFYLQDSWKISSSFTLNYGLRYEIDSQYLPLNTYYGDVAPRISFAWDPFKDHKTVVRGGYGIFYGPIDAQIPQVDLSLGVLNKNHSTVENQHNTSQVPDQVNNAVGTCGVGVTNPPIPRALFSLATVPALVTVSYPFMRILSVPRGFLFYKTPPPSFRPSSARAWFNAPPRLPARMHASPRSLCSQPPRAEFFPNRWVQAFSCRTVVRSRP